MSRGITCAQAHLRKLIASHTPSLTASPFTTEANDASRSGGDAVDGAFTAPFDDGSDTGTVNSCTTSYSVSASVPPSVSATGFGGTEADVVLSPPPLAQCSQPMQVEPSPVQSSRCAAQVHGGRL